MTFDEFFSGHAESRQIFDALSALIESLGLFNVKVSKSQIAFQRRAAFAWAWMPGMYLRSKCAPLVLSIALRRYDESTRWKEIVEPRPGRFMHHLELYSSSDIDKEVRDWLQEARNDA